MQTRRGFTLVEILIVIVIIGLLAGITSVALRGARQSVKSSLISTEMSQLSMALDAYKNKFGEYPPDFSDTAAVEKHLKKRWPRYAGSAADFVAGIRTAWGIPANSDPNNFSDLSYLNPLVIWLGGLPSADDSNKPGGFFLNPTDPFTSSNNQREDTFFDFDPKYIKKEINGAPAFCLNEFPVMYFRPTFKNGYNIINTPTPKYYEYDNDGEISYAVPYYKAYDQANNIAQWYEEDRFQLVHPGLDGLFGLTNDRRVVPTQDGVTSGDADNITNFVTSGTLESLYE